MSENIITLIKQVDLISGIYVHVLIEVIPGTDFNVVQTIRIFVTCYVQCFRIGVTDGWTQTEVELILQNSFEVLCFVHNITVVGIHVVRFTVHHSSIDVVGIIFC